MNISNILNLASLLALANTLYLSEDGGYRDIVVRISDNLDMKKCNEIISGLKVGRIPIKLYSVCWQHSVFTITGIGLHRIL